MVVRHLIFSGLVIGLALTGCTGKKEKFFGNEVLWFGYPAKYWNSQSLHLGNGYFGASFYGGIKEEAFSLSDPSMWAGGPAMGDWEAAGVHPQALSALPAIRNAVVEGESRVADSLISASFFGNSDLYGYFTSIGDLRMRFLHPDGMIDAYSRSLDLARSMGQVSYRIGEVGFHRDYYCSYPDRVLVIELAADQPGQIAFDLYTDIVQDSSLVEIDENEYRLKGFINNNQRPFHIRINVEQEGGSTDHVNDTLRVRAANRATLLLTLATDYEMAYPDYRGSDPEKTTEKILAAALKKDPASLKDRHVRDYQELYNRVDLDLQGIDSVERLPTNERFMRLRAGASDPGYRELAFNLGRYMIISASRPGTLPANLQGLWNVFEVAPWSGNYQSNVNVQEIYCSCGPLNLTECQQPYIDWIEDMAISGREIARRVYGTDGWISHTVGNIWGHAAPIGDHPWGMYAMGSAWHCQHIWDQYAFTQDREYLEKQAYPLLKDASKFWMQNLIPYEGYLITAPSVSAEHGALMTEQGLNPAYHDLRSDKYHYSLPGIYQDMEMLWDLFTNTAEAAGILDETDFADSLISMRERLLPLKIGSGGQLQEWYWDIDDPDCHHRHIAHLYAVAPGRQIHPTSTPELAEAARVALDWRGDGRYMEQELASGGNWARAHRMWCWARLMDGDRADRIMMDMLTEQGFENGLTFQHAEYHWNRPDLYMEDGLYLHFQLDGSAALPGCLAEMLLQSHMGEVHLLPALPETMATGSMEGLMARGGYRIDLSWEDMELKTALIRVPPGLDLPPVRLKSDLVDPETHPKIRVIRL